MRIQNTSKSKATNSKALEGTLTLPVSKEIYETLGPEGKVKYHDGKIKIIIKAESIRNLKIKVNSWIRLYESLKGIEEVSK